MIWFCFCIYENNVFDSDSDSAWNEHGIQLPSGIMLFSDMFNINAGVQTEPLLLFNTAHFQYSHVCFCSKSEQLCCVFTHFWSMSCMFIICQISATICFPRGLECTKFSSRPGLCPGPRWGSLRRSPRPPSRQGGGNSLPKSLPPRCLRHLVQRLWRWIPFSFSNVGTSANAT